MNNQGVVEKSLLLFLHMEPDDFHITSKTEDKSLPSSYGPQRCVFLIRTSYFHKWKEEKKCNNLKCHFPAGFWLVLPQIYEDVIPSIRTENNPNDNSKTFPKSAGERYSRWEINSILNAVCFTKERKLSSWRAFPYSYLYLTVPSKVERAQLL